MRVFSPPSVALAVCSSMPDLDPESRHLADRLSAMGVEAVPAVWDDARVDWNRFGLTVIRCDEGLIQRRLAFLNWASSVQRLANPVDVLAWSNERVTALGLAARGRISLVFVAGQFSHALRSVPELSALGLDGDRHRHRAPSVHMEPTLATGGELSLARHALGRTPGGSDRLLYARVDVAAALVGSPELLGLDLVAPVLHLASADGAADRLAAAIKSRIVLDASAGNRVGTSWPGWQRD